MGPDRMGQGAQGAHMCDTRGTHLGLTMDPYGPQTGSPYGQQMGPHEGGPKCPLWVAHMDPDIIDRGGGAQKARTCNLEEGDTRDRGRRGSRWGEDRGEDEEEEIEEGGGGGEGEADREGGG